MQAQPFPDYYALARLFSSSVIREIARSGHSPLMGRLVAESGLADLLPGSPTLSAFFDEAFHVLQATGNRHEYTYKNAIATNVLLGIHSLNTTCMLTEFRAGKCKADVVLLNGTSTVYEIKSDRDSLDRLHNQLEEYLDIFDIIQVICGERHLPVLERTVPDRVGIQVLTERSSIHTYKRAMPNAADVRPERIFDSLQRHEYLAVLKMNGMEVGKLPNTRIHAVAGEAFASLTPTQAHHGMVEVLKKTRNPVALRHFIHSVPRALKAAALSIPLTQQERARFVKALSSRPDGVIASG